MAVLDGYTLADLVAEGRRGLSETACRFGEVRAATGWGRLTLWKAKALDVRLSIRLDFA